MRSFVTLFFLVSLGAVGAVLYTPALPDIAKDFQVSTGLAQLTVTLYLIGYALVQLPYGPLGNAIGRRQTVYTGCLIGIMGSILAIFTHTFWVLTIARLVMALGMGVGLVSAFAIIGDLYSRTEARKKISYLVLSFAVMPALAIAAGGFLTRYLGWRSCFWALAFYTLFIALITSLLPHTGPKRGLHHLKLSGYWEQFKNPLVMIGGTLMGLGTAFVFIFAAEAPFIAIQTLGISPGTFGLLNFLPYIAFLFGSLLSGYLSHRIHILSTITFGLTLVTISALFMLLTFLMGWVNLWTLFFPIGLAYIGMICEFSMVSATITSQATNKSNASAVMSFLNMAMPTLGVLILGLTSHSILVMPLLLTCISALMIILFFILRPLVKSTT